MTKGGFLLDQGLAELDWEKQSGLLPAIVQERATGRVLMLGWMNREALAKTRATGLATFWSRSRQSLWVKGETSGNSLRVLELRPDCDGDALLVVAEPAGPTCHRGTVSCFGGDDDFTGLEFLGALEKTVKTRKERPIPGSYTSQLFSAGLAEIAKKVGEEAVELVVSALQERRRTVEEAADLLYHLLVFLEKRDVRLTEVVGELERRTRNPARR